MRARQHPLLHLTGHRARVTIPESILRNSTSQLFQVFLLAFLLVENSAEMSLDILTMKARASLLCILLLGTLAAGGCGTSPHQKAQPDPAAINGKSQAWFLENWGTPGAKAKRFFGGETWAYFRLTGTSSSSLSSTAPADCQIRLDFDKKGTLEDSGYSGC